MNCRGRQHGFTLVEALSTLVVFGFFLGILFLTIAWGFRAFSVAVSRSDVTTEARRLSLFIERELQSSSYFSVAPSARSLGTERRDAVCFVSRNDWSVPGAFNTTKGVPEWNRYFLYYATTKKPQGELVRLSINPTTLPPDQAAEVGAFPYSRYSSNPDSFLPDKPSSGYPAEVETARVIASSVQHFEVSMRPVTQELELRILLRQNGMMARRANGDREGGTFELQYLVQPQNTQ